MPNWCTNFLTIEGTPEEVLALKERVKTDELAFSLEKINPTPTAAEELDEQTRGTTWRARSDAITSAMGRPPEAPSWHTWRITHWGTKWDLRADDIESEDDDEPGYWHLRFDTAWSPPSAALQHLFAGTNLDAHFEYVEEGMEFAGYMTWREGLLISSAHGEVGDFEFSREYTNWDREEDDEWESE